MDEILKPKKAKKRKQKMFVLYGYITYEGGSVLGVYNTHKQAEKARLADSGHWDGYEILPFVVNAPTQ